VHRGASVVVGQLRFGLLSTPLEMKDLQLEFLSGLAAFLGVPEIHVLRLMVTEGSRRISMGRSLESEASLFIDVFYEVAVLVGTVDRVLLKLASAVKEGSEDQAKLKSILYAGERVSVECISAVLIPRVVSMDLVTNADGEVIGGVVDRLYRPTVGEDDDLSLVNVLLTSTIVLTTLWCGICCCFWCWRMERRHRWLRSLFDVDLDKAVDDDSVKSSEQVVSLQEMLQSRRERRIKKLRESRQWSENIPLEARLTAVGVGSESLSVSGQPVERLRRPSGARWSSSVPQELRLSSILPEPSQSVEMLPRPSGALRV